MSPALLLRRLREGGDGVQRELSALAASGPWDAWAYPYDAGGIPCVHLQQIRVVRNAPPGTGTRFMEELQALAARHGRWITLEPGQRGDGDAARTSPWKRTTSQGRLRAWYSRLGFRRNAAAGLFQLRGTMHWRPARRPGPD